MHFSPAVRTTSLKSHHSEAPSLKLVVVVYYGVYILATSCQNGRRLVGKVQYWQLDNTAPGIPFRQHHDPISHSVVFRYG